jgi:hypothetical protein
MANQFIISASARNAACDAIVDLIDIGSGVSYLKVYSGTKPANPGTAITTQTLLASLTFSNPAFGTSANGTTTAATITSDTNTVAGTATWFRLCDRNGAGIADGTIATSGADLNFPSGITFTAGGTVSISSLTIQVPSGE